jgi:hypothetical protein
VTDRFRHDDAAYVLGALAPDERIAFEAHLDTCAECRARVAEARAAADLLAGLTVADTADPGPMPDTLLPGLLRRADRERARRSWVIGSLAAVAAACSVALVVLLWPSTAGSPAPALAFQQVRPSPVNATASLVAETWGTEIDLRCHYSYEVQRGIPYRLVVVDDAGAHHAAGSWTLAPGNEVTFTAVTSVPKADIARVLITLANGSPILQLRV